MVVRWLRWVVLLSAAALGADGAGDTVDVTPLVTAGPTPSPYVLYEPVVTNLSARIGRVPSPNEELQIQNPTWSWRVIKVETRPVSQQGWAVASPDTYEAALTAATAATADVILRTVFRREGLWQVTLQVGVAWRDPDSGRTTSGSGTILVTGFRSAGSGAIEGTVTGPPAGGGAKQGLANQTVRLRQGDDTIGWAVTDETGAFRFDAVQPGDYAVDTMPEPADTYDPPPAVWVHVDESQTARVAVRLDQAGQGAPADRRLGISGRIYDAETGADLDGMRVNAENLSGGQQPPLAEQSNGRYDCTNVTYGRYRVIVESVPGYRVSHPPFYVGELTEKAPHATCDFAMEREPCLKKVAIVEPKRSPVGNTTAVKVRLDWGDDYEDPEHLKVTVTQAGEPHQVLRMMDADLPYLEGNVVERRPDGHLTGEWWYGWETIGCWNDTYTILAEARFRNWFRPRTGNSLLADTKTVDVRNLLVSAVETNANNADYFIGFPGAPAAQPPLLQFSLVDEGRTARDDGTPYQYYWAVHSGGQSGPVVASGTFVCRRSPSRCGPTRRAGCRVNHRAVRRRPRDRRPSTSA